MMEQIKCVRRVDIAVRAANSPFEVTVFDTSIGSQNIGDQIIMRAAMRVLESMFPQAHFWSLPTHDIFGSVGHKRLRHSLFSIACGTNLVHARMPVKGLWKLPLQMSPSLPPLRRYRPRKLVMMAVGSNAEALSPGAARFLRRSLWDDVPASVRDKATERLLVHANVAAAHTGCVTMWNLPKDHTIRIPKEKAEAVVVCLTGVRRAARLYVERDIALLDAVAATYSQRFFWPQGQVDLEYYLSLGRSDFEILPHTLAAYDALLASERSLDFVGARLHAGILAMMHDRRPLIVQVDNRATDIAQSVSLPVVDAEDFDQLNKLICNGRETRIALPRKEIIAWKTALTGAVETALSACIDLRPFRGR